MYSVKLSVLSHIVNNQSYSVLVGTKFRRTNAMTVRGQSGMIRNTRGTVPGDVRLNSLYAMHSSRSSGVAFTNSPSVVGGMLMFTSVLEPWVRPTAVALRRLRRLLVSQRFTDIEATGVLIVILGELPMNGFITDIVVYNKIAPSYLRYFICYNPSLDNATVTPSMLTHPL